MLLENQLQHLLKDKSNMANISTKINTSGFLDFIFGCRGRVERTSLQIFGDVIGMRFLHMFLILSLDLKELFTFFAIIGIVPKIDKDVDSTDDLSMQFLGRAVAARPLGI